MDREIKDITKKIIELRDERYHKQFHNPKDLALSMVLEASELLEHFQWKSTEEIEHYVSDHKKEIGDVLADVLYWVLLMSHDLKINVIKILDKKIEKNENGSPIKNPKKARKKK
ncbi:MAG TPA: nucleotide pyrophosphohydrolase [Thermodesulfobacteriota bacterium]|nr:nucleotide pyrophosphohydrolase [Thermodesulfobacteriota bacterium]